MRKYFFLLLFLSSITAIAQEEPENKDEAERKGFKKENLFTGGSISLAFSNNSFLVGGNPVFGYSLTRWADLGLVFNYTYTSYRDYWTYGDKLRQSVYGGGVFTRLFPVRFIFVQTQIEHNWIRLRYIPYDNGTKDTYREEANSLLIGGGYTTGRDPDGKSAFGYLAVLFDILDDPNSPYTDNLGRVLPIIRAGINIPLFQGRRNR